MTRHNNKQDAQKQAIAEGGFVYEYCGEFFHVPASLISVAEDVGMILSPWEDGLTVIGR